MPSIMLMFRAEWKEIYLDQDAAQMIARLSTAIFMPALARNEEWLKIAVDYTVHFFTGAYVLRMIPPPLRPIVHWFLPFTRQLRLTVPYYFITPPAPATTKNLDINFYVNDTGRVLPRQLQQPCSPSRRPRQLFLPRRVERPKLRQQLLYPHHCKQPHSRCTPHASPRS
jgi:hypothetical protein